MNGTGAGGTITLATTAINNAGTITNVGTNAAATATISAAIGSNVTAITQAGTSPFTVSTPITLSSTLNSFTSTGAGLFTFSGALSGSQNLTTFENGTATGAAAGDIKISTTPTLVGTITNAGTGTTGVVSTGAIPANSQNIAAVVQDETNPVSVTGGGNLQLSGASTFTGGVNVASGTSLTLGANSTNNGGGAPLSGPLGTGTLTLTGGSTLLAASTTSYTVTNAVNVLGNFTFAGSTSTASTLTIGGLTTNVTLPASAATTITVNDPVTTGALGGIVQGSGSSIVKAGLGILALTNNNSFTGGVTLNAGTLLAQGINGQGSVVALGSGGVTINGGFLQLHNNGQTSNSNITYGNNVTINSSLAGAYIDVNNSGANTGNTIVMGSLNYTSTAGANPVLYVTGGNSYGLDFTSTNLTSDTTPADFNVATGLTLTLNGSFTSSNMPVNLGPGTLIVTGSTVSGTTPYSLTGTQQIHPTANGTGYQFSTTGVIQLGAGSTLQVVPTVNTSTNPLTATGYTSGGLQGKYYNLGGVTTVGINNVAASSLIGAAVLPGQSPSDASFSIRPNLVASQAEYTAGEATYSGLLDIHTAGTYTFQGGADDEFQLVVDGTTLTQVNAYTSGGTALAVQNPVSVTLSAGYHSIVFKGLNEGGNGGDFLLYGGPDTGSLSGTGNSGGLTVTGGQTPPLQSLLSSNLFYVNGPANSNNAYLNAAQVSNGLSLANNISATIDGLGSDLNSGFASLSLGGGSSSILTINNAGGQGTIDIIGTTTIAAAGQTINTNTGTLYLVGGVSDGGNGLTKTGNGTLILGPSTAFTGALTVSAGFLQVADPAALPSGAGTTTIASGAVLDLNGISNVAGTILLNGTGATTNKFSGTPAALYNSNATAASTTGAISFQTSGVAIGGYGNINIEGVLTDNFDTWTKVGPDMLTLSGNNATSVNGTVTVSNGIFQAGSVNAFGSTAQNGLSITVSSGASLDLNGLNLAGGKIMTLSGAGVTNGTGVSTAGGYGTYHNTLAALFNSNSSSPATLAGSITLAAAASVGNNTYAAATPSLTPQGGDVVLSGSISGAFLLTKAGTDSLFLNNSNESFNDFSVPIGAVIFDGSGAQTSATSDIVNPGGSLILDNTATNVNNRLNGSGRGLWLAGSLTIYGNSGASSTEAITSAGNNIAIGNNSGTSNATGVSVITLVPNSAEPLTLQVNSTNNAVLSRNFASTALYRGTNIGVNAPNTNGSANFIGGTTSVWANSGIIGQTGAVTAANAAIEPWALVDTSATGNGFSFPVYNATNGIAAMTLNSGSFVSTLTATDNVVSSATLTAGSGPIAINSLTLNTGGSVTVSSGSLLQVESGGLLGIGTASVSGQGFLTAGATAGTPNGEVIIHAPNPDAGGTTTFTIAAPIYDTAAQGLTKADNGMATLTGGASIVGQLTVNGGTLQLAAGNQSIFQLYEVPATPGNSTNATTQGQVTQLNLTGTLDLDPRSASAGITSLACKPGRSTSPPAAP